MQQPNELKLVPTNPPDPAQRQLLVNGEKEERYGYMTPPPASSALVQSSKRTLMGCLSLDTMASSLLTAADTLYLAMCAVTGTPLAGAVLTHEMNLSSVLDDCRVAVDDVSDQANMALEYLVQVFSLLPYSLDGAVSLLPSVKQTAEKLSNSCKSLSGKVETLINSLHEDSMSADGIISSDTKLIADIEHARVGLQNSLQAQEQVKNNLIGALSDLQSDFDSATQEEDTASKRALISAIVGAVAQVAGAGLGAFVTYETMGLNKLGSLDSKAKDQESGTPSKSTEGGEKEASSNKKAAETNKLHSESEPSEGAKNLGAGSKNEVDNAPVSTKGTEKGKSDETTEPPVKDSEGKITDSSGEEKERGQETTDSKAATGATLSDADKKKLAIAVAKGGQAAAESIVKSTASMQTENMNAVQRAQALRVQILNCMYADEALKRGAMGQIASLQVLITASTDKEDRVKSTLAAIEAAKWALNQASVALSRNEKFWSSMGTYCTELSNNFLLTKVRNISDEQSVQDVCQSDSFVNSAIRYVAGWQALITVCSDYSEVLAESAKEVSDNLLNTPTIQDAKKKIGPLKQKMEERVARQKIDSDNFLTHISSLKFAAQLKMQSLLVHPSTVHHKSI
ncbi:hypothetical protein BWQ96_04247 [Gracilariopsis chorda]|uniref:Uncharacterized protein n=1 Tax=Gracilariopsis chorda TaxID=448386 RepID=A0A2V3IV44_9FLOR|nr:hypothetical protein BWQ96_04247 [Gracilariopsis chorda]|eukprot:PXF45991.1 hypothetical protein BWQ96_04247 [Gracilariopsis chorda]